VWGVATHPFLSPSWIEAAREIHDEYKDQVDEPTESIRMNVTVTAAPFTDDAVLGHVDTTNGSVVPDEGHIDEPDVSVTLPYDLARQLLIDPQPENVMIAFMSGEIEVEGDVTLMMSLQDLEATPEQQELAEEVVARLTAITE
jgi:putative sterol carrier protein